MNNSVRKITDGAMMCAIVGLLLVVNRQFAGMLEEMFLFFFPLPMVFYGAKYGMKNSWVVLFAIVLLSFIIGTPQTLFYVASESFLGMMYGSGIYDHKDSKKLLFLAIMIGIFVNIITTVVYASFFGYDLAAEMAEYEKIITDTFAKSGMNLPATVNLKQMLTTVILVSVVLTGVLQGIITHVFARLLLKRLRFTLPPSTPLAFYYPKKWTGYVGILGLVVYYYTLYNPLSNTGLQTFLQGAGLCGVIYLCFMGAISLVVQGGLRNPKLAGFRVILSFFLTMMFMLPMAMLGFLYITTNWHTNMLKGATYVTKNK